MWPRPRPDIIGTITPHAAASGARISDVLSPTPPVLCLSTFDAGDGRQVDRDPGSHHGLGQPGRLLGRHPPEDDGHQQGGGLVVGQRAVGDAGHEELDRLARQRLAVALGANDVGRTHRATVYRRDDGGDGILPNRKSNPTPICERRGTDKQHCTVCQRFASDGRSSAEFPPAGRCRAPDGVCARLQGRGARRVASTRPSTRRSATRCERLARAAASATEDGPLSMLVVRRQPARRRPDRRAARRRHRGARLAPPRPHGRANSPSSATWTRVAWRTLLGAARHATPRTSARRGGLARALTTAGGVGIEIAELDYSGPHHGRASGTEASWDTIIVRLPPEGRDRPRREDAPPSSARSPATRSASRSSSSGPRASRATTRRATAAPASCAPCAASPASSARGTRQARRRASTTWRPPSRACRPTSSLELVDDRPRSGLRAREPRRRDHRAHHRPDALAQFVARAVAHERACTGAPGRRLPRPGARPRARRRSPAIAREELERTPIGEEPDFGRIWSQVEDMLLSYSDKRYVSEDYDRELASARAHTAELDQITDDPPERIVGWLTTVSDVSIRALDLQLLGRPARWSRPTRRSARNSCNCVVSQVDELVALGDFDGARRLVEAMAAVATRPERRRGPPAGGAGASSNWSAGRSCPRLAVHLDAVRDDEFEHVKGLCAAIGPALVPKLAETLLGRDPLPRPPAADRPADRVRRARPPLGGPAPAVAQPERAPHRRAAAALVRRPRGAARPRALVNDTEPAVQRDAARALIGLGIDESFEHAAADPRHREAPRPRGRHRRAGIDARPEGGAALLLPGATPRVPRGRCATSTSARSPPRRAGRPRGGRGAGGGAAEGRLVGAVPHARDPDGEAAAALAQITLPAAQEALREAAANGSFGVRSIARSEAASKARGH